MRRIHGLQIEGEHRPSDVSNERWDRQDYESAVEATLEQIISTHVGRIVVRFAAMQQQAVRIFPQRRWHDPELPRATVADGTPLGPGYLARCPLSYDGFDRPVPGAPQGTGEPADVIVWFSPGLFHRHGANEQQRHEYRGPGYYGDAILLHELVHAVRLLRGVSDPSPRRRRYDTFEEVCAIFVTNMYRSEMRRDLIGSHTRGHARLQYPPGSPQERERRQWETAQTSRFRRQMPVFTAMLGNVRPDVCAYNPFWAGHRQPIYG